MRTNIEIDDARTASDEFPAAKRSFNSLQRVQQLPRH